MDSPERGFSFMADGPLDMRMAPELQPMDAAAIVNSWPEAELARIIRDYGEDRAANSIAARCAIPPLYMSHLSGLLRILPLLRTELNLAIWIASESHGGMLTLPLSDWHTRVLVGK